MGTVVQLTDRQHILRFYFNLIKMIAASVLSVIFNATILHRLEIRKIKYRRKL